MYSIWNGMSCAFLKRNNNMKKIQKKSESQLLERRRFLAATARGGVWAAMGGLASILFLKRTRLEREGKCVDPADQLGCRRCGLLASCRLPRALSAKQASGETRGK